MIQACYQPLQPHYQVQQVFHRTPRNSVFLSTEPRLQACGMTHSVHVCTPVLIMVQTVRCTKIALVIPSSVYTLTLKQRISIKFIA